MADMNMQEFLSGAGFEAPKKPEAAAPKEMPSEVATEITAEPQQAEQTKQEVAKPSPKKEIAPARAKPMAARKYNLADAVVSSLSNTAPALDLVSMGQSAFKYGMGLVNPEAAKDTESMTKAAAVGAQRGVEKPILGTAQTVGHVLPSSTGAAPKTDALVTERQKSYEENPDVVKHPTAAGAGEFVGETAAMAPAALAAPESIGGTMLLGGALGMTSPVADTSKGDFAKQKGIQALEGAGTSLIPTALANTGKYLLRGGKEAAQKMAKNLNLWKETGISKEAGAGPSLGQVSEGGITHETGSTKARLQNQLNALEKKSGQAADKFSPAQTKAEAGTNIKENILGTPETETVKIRGKKVDVPTGKTVGGWLSDTEKKEGELYDKAYKRIGPKTKVDLENTFRTLDEITTPNPGARRSTAMSIPNDVKELLVKIRADAADASKNGRSLSFESVRELRSAIGKAVKDAKLNGETPMEEAANKIYAAFSQDLRNTVKSKGPVAQKLMADALEFSKAKHEKLDNFIEPLTKKRTPEQGFDFTMAETKKGATQLKEVMSTMNPSQKKDLAAVALREMSKSNQKFDPEAFYSGWNNMHKDAKDALFGANSSQRKAIDKLMTVYEQMSAGHGAKGGKILERITHHGGENLSPIIYLNPGVDLGRAITNPTILSWLAKTVNKPTNQLGAALGALSQQSQKLSPDDRAEVQDYINQVKAYEKEHGEE